MSQLSSARAKANSIRSLIRQQKYLPAIQALYDTVQTMVRNPLLKSEREEFEQLISDGAYHIMADQTIRKSAALEIKYVAGQEKELLDSLVMLIEVFQDNMQQEAEDALRLIQERREKALSEGQAFLDANELDSARQTFADIVKEDIKNGELRADIGERFLRAKQYEDAEKYLGEALDLIPGAAHLYNSLAMAQRKNGNYPAAEQSYLKAGKGGYKDPHLFFNMGRLYIDWKKWDKAIKAAQGALTMDPSFEEAHKLITYAQRMAGQTEGSDQE